MMDRDDTSFAFGPCVFSNEEIDVGVGPSESQIAIEHQAALDATLFSAGPPSGELILQLEAGELVLHVGARGARGAR